MCFANLTFPRSFQKPLKKCEVCAIIMKRYVQEDYIKMLSEIIKMTRQKAFLSQESFANELNVSVSTINRWETGKVKPNLTAMKSLKEFCSRHGLSYDVIEDEWFSHLQG